LKGYFALTISKAGLSFSEAAQEALNEVEVSDSTATPDNVVDSVSEQPTVAEQPETKTSKPSVLEDLLDRGPGQNNTNVSDSAVVNLNGTLVSIGELKNGYMRQDDYTRKTQAHAENVKEYDNAVTLWKALQENPVETLRKLNVQANQGQRPTAQLTGAKDVDIDALVEQKLKERLENDPNLRALQDERAREAVDKEFRKIETAYAVELADEDKAMVLAKARDMGTTDLMFVFGGLYALAEKQRVAKRNAKTLSTDFGYRGDADTPSVDRDEPILTFQDAIEAATRELKMDSLI
jgi:hypothetical protein